jgi:hypothetical protein
LFQEGLGAVSFYIMEEIAIEKHIPLAPTIQS